MECPFCSIERGKEFFMNSFGPTVNWMKVIKRANGYMLMKFGCGEDENDTLIFSPKFCPECGKKIEVDKNAGEMTND